MADLERAARDLKAVHRLLEGIGPTGFAGADANIETAVTCIRLALLALAEEPDPMGKEGSQDGL